MNPTTYPDGVPFHGPMAEYVNRAMDKAHSDHLAEFHYSNPEQAKAKVIAARKLAIAQWNAQQVGLTPSN